MLFQSAFLLYQRLQISQHPKVKRNSLGLVIVNISYIAAFSFISYSTLTIYTLLVQIAMDWGHDMDEAMMLFIFGIRFLTVIVGSWAFLWVCACQCALILWNSTLASKMNRDRLKNLIQYGSSFLILLFALGPLLPIAWQYIKAYQALHQIETITHHISSTLRSRADNYDPNNFNQLSLLSLLIPAKKLLPLRARMEGALRLGQKMYLVDLGHLSLVYIPLLVISLRHLYKQSKFQAEIDAATGTNNSNESPISKRIRRQRQRLVLHAISVYLATSIHLPVVIYEIFLSSKPGFSQTAKWCQLTFVGLTAPLSFTGNIVLLVLNIHSYLILRDRTHPKLQSTKALLPSPPNLTAFQKARSYVLEFFRRWDTTLELEDLVLYKNGQTEICDITGISISIKGEGLVTTDLESYQNHQGRGGTTDLCQLPNLKKVESDQ